MSDYINNLNELEISRNLTNNANSDRNPLNVTGQVFGPPEARVADWHGRNSLAQEIINEYVDSLNTAPRDPVEVAIQFHIEHNPSIRNGVRFFNPHYRPPTARGDVGAAGGTAANPTQPPAAANRLRWNLSPVPAAIDLSRNRRREPIPPEPVPMVYEEEFNGGTAANPTQPPAAANRLRWNLSPVPAAIDLTRNRRREPIPQIRLVPMVYDEEFNGFRYIQSDSDEEEKEVELPPPKMVPRRGNSISDLSQCSSDDESVPKN